MCGVEEDRWREGVLGEEWRALSRVWAECREVEGSTGVRGFLVRVTLGAILTTFSGEKW